MTGPLDRGILHEDYGIAPAEIHWRTGGLEKVGANPSSPSLPREIKVTPIGDQETLAGMLASGELAALVSAREPSCFGPQNPELCAYFRTFGLWKGRGTAEPTISNHACSGYSKGYCRERTLDREQCSKSFKLAKDICLQEMSDVTALSVSMPWIAAELLDTRALMGHDIWPYS